MESPLPDKPITFLSVGICAIMMPIELLILELEAVLFQCAVQEKIIKIPQKYIYLHYRLLPERKSNSYFLFYLQTFSKTQDAQLRDRQCTENKPDT